MPVCALALVKYGAVTGGNGLSLIRGKDAPAARSPPRTRTAADLPAKLAQDDHEDTPLVRGKLLVLHAALHQWQPCTMLIQSKPIAGATHTLALMPYPNAQILAHASMTCIIMHLLSAAGGCRSATASSISCATPRWMRQSTQQAQMMSRCAFPRAGTIGCPAGRTNSSNLKPRDNQLAGTLWWV